MHAYGDGVGENHFRDVYMWYMRFSTPLHVHEDLKQPNYMCVLIKRPSTPSSMIIAQQNYVPLPLQYAGDLPHLLQTRRTCIREYRSLLCTVDFMQIGQPKRARGLRIYAGAHCGNHEAHSRPLSAARSGAPVSAGLCIDPIQKIVGASNRVKFVLRTVRSAFESWNLRISLRCCLVRELSPDRCPGYAARPAPAAGLGFDLDHDLGQHQHHFVHHVVQVLLARFRQ